MKMVKENKKNCFVTQAQIINLLFGFKLFNEALVLSNSLSLCLFVLFVCLLICFLYESYTHKQRKLMLMKEEKESSLNSINDQE